MNYQKVSFIVLIVIIFLVGCEAQFVQGELDTVTSKPISEPTISVTPKPSLTPSANPSPTPSLMPAPTAKATLLPVPPVELNTDK